MDQNLHKDLFFSTPVYTKDLINHKYINKHLIDNIIKLKEINKEGISRSNCLGWHSQSDLHNKKEYEIILNEIYKMQEEIYKIENYHVNTKPKCQEMWANVNYKYSYNKEHIHPDTLWSGVYYVKISENCGKLFLKDPAKIKEIKSPILNDENNRLNYQWPEMIYTPIEGRLIMFPSWLPHDVGQNMSDDFRISISFNLNQVWKNENN